MEIYSDTLVVFSMEKHIPVLSLVIRDKSTAETIYRAAYTTNNNNRVRFSVWLTASGQEGMITKLENMYQRDEDGNPIGDPLATIIGWEELTLDTEPV